MTAGLEQIILDTIKEVAARAVKSAVANEGWGANSDIKALVFKEAERLTREDEEIKTLLRESLKKAITR